MKTYTTLRNGTAGFCNVSTSDTTKMTTLDGYINDSILTICNLQGGKLRFLEATKDMTTVASQSSYQIPAKFRKLIDLYVFSGSASTDTLYSPEMIFDPTRWKNVLQAKLGESSTPYFSYVEDQKFYLYPTPSTTGNLITLRGRVNIPVLSIADYSTGTITSIANGDTTVTASGSTFTADMVGRYINIPQTTAALGGDGLWYEIGSYTSATVIDLLKPYEGTTIAAGSASYTIGQVPVIPEAYQPAILYRSSALYWMNQNDLTRAQTYWMLYDGGNEAGLNRDYGGLISQMLANEGETEEGAYIPPAGQNSLNQDPYYDSYQNASGLT